MIRPVLQLRQRTVSRMQWFRCLRCARLTYAPVIALECDPCVKAAREVWPWSGSVTGEMSGC
jgi:hypothetical protein